MRASLGVALAVLGAVGAIAAGSHTASASTADSFTVVSAGASATNPDQLTVVVDSSSTITGLTAQFLNGAVDEYDQALTLGSTAPDPTDPTRQRPPGPRASPRGHPAWRSAATRSR